MINITEINADAPLTAFALHERWDSLAWRNAVPTVRPVIGQLYGGAYVASRAAIREKPIVSGAAFLIALMISN